MGRAEVDRKSDRNDEITIGRLKRRQGRVVDTDMPDFRSPDARDVKHTPSDQ